MEQKETFSFPNEGRCAKCPKNASGIPMKVFAKIAIRQILKLSASELPKKLTIPFELEQDKIRYGS